MSEPFNREKFHELIVYIAKRLGPEAALGRVKLAKLLMQSDFGAYQRFGRSITGATYEKWEHGHLPREFLLAQRNLEAEGAIATERVEYFGKRLNQVTARRDPDMSGFTEDEIAIIEVAIREYGYESATYLSRLSHEELGWRLAAWKEVIPYNTVFLGSRGPTEADIRRGQELASQHHWN
jgi:sarcosine oxidase delta subunit